MGLQYSHCNGCPKWWLQVPQKHLLNAVWFASKEIGKLVVVELGNWEEYLLCGKIKLVELLGRLCGD